MEIYSPYTDNEFSASIELKGKIKCINEAHEKILPSTEMLKSFGNELISEFGKNEFTDSINIQCHETALKILKEFHNSIADTRIDTPGLKRILQEYTDDLKKFKPSSEVLNFTEPEKPKESFNKEHNIILYIILILFLIILIYLRFT